MLGAVCALLPACALRSTDVPAATVSPGEFGGWTCDRIDAELDRVQRHATQVAYAFDERAGANVVAMGVGAMVFWPALLAMRTNGEDRELLAQLKGRYEALRAAHRARPCDSAAATPPEGRAWPVAVGQRLVYEQRSLGEGRGAAADKPREIILRLDDLGRATLSLTDASDAAARTWQFDRRGNLLQATIGPLWPQLVRTDLELGVVLAGDMVDAQDASVRARLRGQVVALGPQRVAGHSFDAVVIDLFGDVQDGQTSTRMDGVLVVDRATGLLLRLDLYGQHPAFRLQRRLVRVLDRLP